MNENYNEPYLVCYVEAIKIYTQLKIIIPFFSVHVNPWKRSPHWSNINIQKVFQRLHTGVKLRCEACLSLQILSFKYLH